MAEIFVKGVDGFVHLSAKLQARVTNWTMTMTAPVEDVTDFGSDGQENEFTGLSNFSGTLAVETLRSDAATTQPLQTIMRQFANGGTLAKTTIKLKESSKAMWSGAVLVTGMSKDAPAQSLQSESVDWVQASGRMTFATSTA
jgi:hypothetical protein